MKLYNTLTRNIDEIQPQSNGQVTIYTCGPTVYDYPHIGNWFTFIRYDLLVRTLRMEGLNPKWVLNITDVGHLVSDADEGEDKLEKGAKREGKTAWDIATFYSDYFIDGLTRLNITKPDVMPRATEHIAEQIALIQSLETRGFTYVIDDGVYYDTSKFEGYAAFARLDLDDQQAGARVAYNEQKRNPSDFALWKFSPKDSNRDMEWWAPWQRPGETSDEKYSLGQPRATGSDSLQGAVEKRTESYGRYDEGASKAATQQAAEKITSADSSAGGQGNLVSGSWGFPGWHIECSAMALKYLGATIDIHAGGIDHIPVHHTNEIAQSEAASGVRFANYWMHTNHILISDEKISKSLGNTITLEDIEAKGVRLEAFRLHVLESHYRSQSKFSWESLQAAENRLKAYKAYADLLWELPDSSSNGQEYFDDILQDIKQALANDLDTPNALARLSTAENEWMRVLTTDKQSFKSFLQSIDSLLGLNLSDTKDITDEQYKLIEQRDVARQNKDWQKADELRDRLQQQGVGLRDVADSAIWYRI